MDLPYYIMYISVNYFPYDNKEKDGQAETPRF